MFGRLIIYTMQNIYDDPVETIPVSVWSWLWVLLAEELGSSRAAELYNELCDRRSVLCQPFELIDRMRQLGAYARPDET
jgi:hypothetical protein